MSTAASKTKSRKTKIAGQGKPDALTLAALADGQAPIPAEDATLSGYYEEQGPLAENYASTSMASHPR